ncbi:DUF4926 domain-containing protein [Tychonema sp. LEGE 06208]|nr:DUF4926 domain-containing protein [Tychonema sp. LEGE 06208]
MKLLDVVALLEDLPEQGLYRGQVGTVIDEYDAEFVEVEFSDLQGCTYALEAGASHFSKKHFFTLQCEYLKNSRVQYASS